MVVPTVVAADPVIVVVTVLVGLTVTVPVPVTLLSTCAVTLTMLVGVVVLGDAVGGVSKHVQTARITLVDCLRRRLSVDLAATVLIVEVVARASRAPRLVLTAEVVVAALEEPVDLEEPEDEITAAALARFAVPEAPEAPKTVLVMVVVFVKVDIIVEVAVARFVGMVVLVTVTTKRGAVVLWRRRK